jgi:hypothetical protein
VLECIDSKRKNLGWGSWIRIEPCALRRIKKFVQSLMSLEALAPVPFKAPSFTQMRPLHSPPGSIGALSFFAAIFPWLQPNRIFDKETDACEAGKGDPMCVGDLDSYGVEIGRGMQIQ